MEIFLNKRQDSFFQEGIGGDTFKTSRVHLLGEIYDRLQITPDKGFSPGKRYIKIFTIGLITLSDNFIREDPADMIEAEVRPAARCFPHITMNASAITCIRNDP